ncbi:GNAT family N-acetyltransferase [Brevundimonas sp.]|uniref:GNAT family N-acetyltransferase n=1 Tax=Brevundimonas sp. TaxID=1871086 RepID=UPI002637BF03|nr:GNAT family N-acetyltransferase [Brevundimonas sp.]
MPIVELTSDDALLVENYGLHWLEMGIGTDDTRADWRAEAHRFLVDARKHAGLASFMAKVDGEPVGTACCHILPRAFPAFRKGDAARIGYVWGVYVRPEHRGIGVGAMLVSACMSHLKVSGCGRVLLHAGERSASLYGRMGFMPTEEYSAAL